MKKKRRDGKREPNGRLSRRPEDTMNRITETEAQIKSVALEARQRHTGIWAEVIDIAKPNPGTEHGVLCLQGVLTGDQWSAAEWYLNARACHLRAICAPGGEGSSRGSANPPSEHDSKYIRWAQESEDMWGLIRKCLVEASAQSRSPILAAFAEILEKGNRMDHMTGDLRLGLNALHRSFFIDRRNAA